MNNLNTYQNNIYTNVFITPLSWCNIRTDFYSSDVDIGYVCNRKKALEPLKFGDSFGLFFHPRGIKS